MVQLREITKELEEILVKKELAYGKAFTKAQEFFKLLYPNGIKPEQYANALTLLRVFDKMMRIATNGSSDPMQESPQMDAAGYFILSERDRREEIKETIVKLAEPIQPYQRPSRYEDPA